MAGGERRAQVLALLTANGLDLVRLCNRCLTELPDISGAGIAVMTTLPARGIRYVSDKISGRVEELQFSLGEGPCFETFETGQPVLVADLADRKYALRWPAFTAGALVAGARALFAFPLRIGAINLGVLDLYRQRPGALTDDEHTQALVFADTATLLLLAEGQSQAGDRSRLTAYDERAVVHQATGMVAVQTGSTIPEALARLRAYAYGEDRTLAGVADDVVERRLRFDKLGD
jgi:GAF domain-containing protein